MKKGKHDNVSREESKDSFDEKAKDSFDGCKQKAAEIRKETMKIMTMLEAMFRKNQKIDAREAIARMTDDEGYGKNRIKFYHLGERNHPHKGVMTIATQVMDDGELYIGLSYCSKKDHFVKAKGREIAYGRLQKGGAYHYHTKFTGNSGIDFKRIFNRGTDDTGKVIVKPQGFRKWYVEYHTDGKIGFDIYC